MKAGIATKFLQTVPLVVDDKGRITLPSHIRSAIEALETQGVVVVKSDANYLVGYNEPTFDGIMERMNSAPQDGEGEPSDEDMRNAELIARHGYGDVAYCIPDKQGRINIPQAIREGVGIFPNGKIVMVGLGDRVEIWPLEKFNADRREFDEKFKSGAINLKKYHAKLRK